MGEFWRVEREVGNVAVVVIDRGDMDVNVLSEKVLRELNAVLDSFQGDASLEGVVFISGKKDFIVGADIDEIAAMKTAEAAADGSRQMQAILAKIAELPVPTVAAINGQALGGGLELTLACTWRIATTDPRTKLGLPEIQLGLIPGAGGTQRLPRLIGIQGALDLILTGKRLGGKKAEKLGLVDACVPPTLLREQAVRYAQMKKPPHRRMPDLNPGKLAADLPKWATEGNPIGRKLIQKKAREMVDEKTKGFYPASYKALEAVFEGYDLPLPKALELEATLFGQLAITRESQSLVHLFHATNSLKKHRFKAAGRERFGTSKVKTVGIIGSGFMGAGIATVAVEKGIRVRLSDPNQESIGRALKHARDYFQKKLDRRRIKSFELTQKMAHLSPGLGPTGFGHCDLVVEAVFEDLKLKQKLLKQVEDIGGEDFIFASNTSALPIGKIAETAKHPERVIGMHFFSPVEKMPLLEVVVTDQTADWVAARTVDLGQDLGKQVIVVKDGPGFYTTRALAFYLNEASSILLEGAPIEQIDKALVDFGFPVGPITLIDEVGIDVGMHVLETIASAFEDRMVTPKGLAPIADSGRLGRKNNKGFYTYENGKKGRPDTAIYELLGTPKAGDKISGDKISNEEIVDRCLLLFVNESIRCLEDGILASAGDGDVGAVFGLGFPPFWGGPFKYVDLVGAQTVVERLKQLADRHGSRFRPASLLLEHAETKQRFFPGEA
jgi:3-hydroxyacyl-CoA dehydrogenase/enoyl-CoA hydratase/3-hydroxybutyryl-CoA epimerase